LVTPVACRSLAGHYSPNPVVLSGSLNQSIRMKPLHLPTRLSAQCAPGVFIAMRDSIRDEQYRDLAELRHQIRLFLQRSDLTAREIGLEPQQYQLLLCIRGMSPERPRTIRAISERLLLKHHSTVELVDRMEANHLVSRSRDQEDRRQVFVRLEPKGERLLAQVVRKRVDDLQAGGRKFVKALTSLLDKNGKGAARRSSRKPVVRRTQTPRPRPAYR
jgi:DNA-binding MarR family transcriptional regulator